MCNVFGANNVDIGISAYGAFLRQHSSDTLVAKRFEIQIVQKSLAAIKSKGRNRIAKNCIRPSMLEGGVS
jgi:hypothetical protein